MPEFAFSSGLSGKCGHFIANSAPNAPKSFSEYIRSDTSLPLLLPRRIPRLQNVVKKFTHQSTSRLVKMPIRFEVQLLTTIKTLLHNRRKVDESNILLQTML